MLQRLKSKYILETIFCFIKNRKKLNIIKYNKRILARLKINKKHFENYIRLKEFNNNYNTNIEDIDIKELNLEKKIIGNEVLKFLFKTEFKELKKLYLSYNEISDINILEKVNFKELKELNLSYNKISDINILGKVNFKQLIKLNLYSNNISKTDNYSLIDSLKLKIRNFYV